MAKTASKAVAKTKTVPYDVSEQLRTPEEMAAYLEACFEEADGDAAFIAKALGDIARAKGMSQVARDAGLSRESLYKALSGERSPDFDTILKVIAAHDVGVAINPQKIEGQIEGSVLMGLGYALKEEFVVEKWMFKSRTYRSCGIPTIRDMPSIEVIIIEDPEPVGPYGAKGISEIATVPATPAILNAIYDAIGKRVYAIPAKPDRILELLDK